MPEPQHDYRMDTPAVRRLRARVDLMFARFCDQYGIPNVTEEDIDKVLAMEGITPPVKSPATRDDHLSTGDPSIHMHARSNPLSRKEV